MAVVKLTYKREEYDKYDSFTEYDRSRDMTTTVFLPFYVKAAFKRFYRNTARLILTDTKGREIDSLKTNLFYPLARAVAFECARIWVDRVGDISLDRMMFNSAGVASLPNIIVPAFHGSIRSKKFVRTNVIMSRFVRGMFEEPLRDFDIFPLGFSYPYSLMKFLLLRNELPGALVEDAKFTLNTMDNIIDIAREKIRSAIATGGTYITMAESIRLSAEGSAFLQNFIDQGYLALSKVKKSGFLTVDELSRFAVDPYLDGYWLISVIDSIDLVTLRSMMNGLQFEEIPLNENPSEDLRYGLIWNRIALWRKLNPDAALHAFLKVYKGRTGVTLGDVSELHGQIGQGGLQ